MPLQETSGTASYDAFGGGAPVAAKYIEDFFQTWLRTGTGSSTTVTTGLNGAINETMVWTKSRSAATNHKLTDNVRGATKALSSNTTGAEVTDSQGLTAFSSTGYTIGTNTDYNNSGATYVDWQWVATPKFFDVVTYTGNGVAGRTISHSLGSVPGCIIVKRTDTTGNWQVYHNSLGVDSVIYLNLTNAATTASGFWGTPTSTNIVVGSNAGYYNVSGATYVAYLFAHNAGGFGLTGTDNVISCGFASGGGEINLGWEPQWLLVKTTGIGSWAIWDTMRGWTTDGNVQSLLANTSGSETSGTGVARPTATGLNFTNTNDFIYIAIRRGPMKTPTSGASVFVPAIGNNSTSAGGEIFTTNFPVDFFMRKVRATTDFAPFAYSRLTAGKYLVTGTTAAEATDTSTWFDTNTGIDYQYASNFSGQIGWLFQRAPGFFDEVCYTGTGVARTVNHNLGVAPELMIVKARSVAGYAWFTYVASLGNTQFLRVNTTNAAASDGGGYWNSTSPTSTVFSLADSVGNNGSGSTYVAYLFASCPGVSKVGSYTGNGSSQTINCGFTGGARFVLIKRTDSTGDWYVYDTARGMTTLTDPYLLLNSTAAESATLGSVTSVTGGFALNASILAAINTNGGSYIFLAIS